MEGVAASAGLEGFYFGFCDISVSMFYKYLFPSRRESLSIYYLTRVVY